VCERFGKATSGPIPRFESLELQRFCRIAVADHWGELRRRKCRSRQIPGGECSPDCLPVNPTPQNANQQAASIFATGPTSGSRVLDVAAGAGDQSMVAAKRVGPTGSVLATDISPNILEFAAENARMQGYANFETQVADGEALDVPAAGFDAAISRVGLIYFPDQQKALASIRRALRPGGRFAAVVYATPQNNGFFSVPVPIIRDRAKLPPPAVGQPGPFSLGAPGVLAETLAKAVSPISKNGSSARRCFCQLPPTACGSSASHSAPFIRCSAVWTQPLRTRSGVKSPQRLANTRPPPALSRPAKWWLPQAPTDTLWT
jgi:SAM-dependent methyltransferase